MKRLLPLVGLLLLTLGVSADPREVSGRASGPVVALVTGEASTLRLWRGDALVREWTASGPFAAAVVLTGELDRLQWEGATADLRPAGAEPATTARQALEALAPETLVLITADGALQMVRGVEGEADAVSAASAEE